MKFISLIIFFLIIPLVYAETTFFDQDDAFIMGESTTGGAIGGTTGGGGCRYEWVCTNWSICFPSGKQTRDCTNIGACSDTYKSPETEQNCTYPAPELKKENKELKKENETEKSIVEKEIMDRNKIIVYSIIILIIISVILCLKKNIIGINLIKNLILQIRKGKNHN